MKIQKLFFISIIPFLFFGNLNAQNDDNLNPVGGIFDEFSTRFEYHSQIRKILLNGMSDYPMIRFLIIPSFSNEEVVAIEHIDEKYYIIHHKASKSIWYTENDKEKIKIIQTKTEIKKEDAELFFMLFKQAIESKKTKADINWTPDVINYYFSVGDKGMNSGTICSPKEKTKMKRLIEIGYSIIELTIITEKEKVAEMEPELTNRIRKLTAELK